MKQNAVYLSRRWCASYTISLNLTSEVIALFAAISFGNYLCNLTLLFKYLNQYRNNRRLWEMIRKLHCDYYMYMVEIVTKMQFENKVACLCACLFSFILHLKSRWIMDGDLWMADKNTVERTRTSIKLLNCIRVICHVLGNYNSQWKICIT